MLVASALSAFLVVAAADDAPAAAPVAVENDVAVPSFVDEGVALDSLNVLLQHGREAARIALYIDDADAGRRVSLERTLLRALRDRRREDIVSPSLVKATLSATALSSLKGGDGVVPGLAADHVIVGVVSESSSGATLNLRLLFTQTGEVLSTGALALTASQRASTASARDVRTVASDIADVIAESVEARGVDVRQHRLAVTPANAAGAAKEARLDRFVQTELSAALRRRGFLVVERAQIAATLDQLAVQELGSERVAEVGKMLGAQSLVLSGVTDAGASFILTSRAVAVDSGDVLGAASALIGRDDVVSLAAVETRTPGEAAVRSAIAPGWGQAFNGDGVKAVLFGVGTYTSLAVTAGLGAGSAASWLAYTGFTATEGDSPEVTGQKAVALRNQTNGLLTATAVAGAVSASVWGMGVVDALLSAPPEG